MGRVCTICTNPEREAIDAALVSGMKYSAVARQYSVGSESVRRHHDAHLSPALAAMAAEREAEAAAGLVGQVRQLVCRADELYEAAVLDGKVSNALAALREMRGSLELLGKATGELDDRPQVTINLMQSPEWLAVRAALFAALAAYPEARQAVAGRLLQLEAGPS